MNLSTKMEVDLGTSQKVEKSSEIYRIFLIFWQSEDDPPKLGNPGRAQFHFVDILFEYYLNPLWYLIFHDPETCTLYSMYSLYSLQCNSICKSILIIFGIYNYSTLSWNQKLPTYGFLLFVTLCFFTVNTYLLSFLHSLHYISISPYHRSLRRHPIPSVYVHILDHYYHTSEWSLKFFSKIKILKDWLRMTISKYEQILLMCPFYGRGISEDRWWMWDHSSQSSRHSEIDSLIYTIFSRVTLVGTVHSSSCQKEYLYISAFVEILCVYARDRRFVLLHRGGKHQDRKKRWLHVFPLHYRISPDWYSDYVRYKKEESDLENVIDVLISF